MLYNKLLALVALPTALALPSLVPRDCDYTCGHNCYSSSEVAAAQSAGYQMHASGQTLGHSHYPHKYNNYEGFDFPVPGTYYEWPILSSGRTYTGGAPGADRVVFNSDDALAGLITHNGARGNNFVACT
ncbi:guanyl-specific ribonuclease Ap1 [Aspergillus coremiiformis]|uniref:ribonuclease T1 n=1 Tax=Aspergillus coremiiformis TaxID=138285 RepID=A0A5N6Z5X7_9EURO|nr:guanyl-specific ribonuclease Ap1 [Aspergillus coremiiformis]